MFDGEAFGREIVVVLKQTIDPLREHIAELEQRIKQLEARGEVKMCGVWSQDREYENGNLAVYSGSLWCAQARTKSRPGTDSSWQLYVKQGTFSK